MRILKFISIFLLSLSFAGLSAQVKLDPSMLDRKWQVDFDMYEHISNMPEAEWEAFNSLPYSKKKEIEHQMRQDAASSVFEFKSDLTFVILKQQEIVEEGFWLIQPDGKTIIARNDQGFEDKITLIELTQDKIVFSSEQYGQKVTLIPLESN